MNCERNKFSAKKKVKNKNKNESLDRCMQSPIKHDEITLSTFFFFLQSFSQLVNITNYDRYKRSIFTTYFTT